MDKREKICETEYVERISEIFWTTDKDFGFQRVRNVWNLYERDNGWYFVKDFRSFWRMEQYIKERREEMNDGNRLESESGQEV